MNATTYDTAWKKVFHEGVVPFLGRPALENLRAALARDDPHLIQGATTTPPPLQCVQDWLVEEACLLGWCGVYNHGGWGRARVAEVEDFFSKTCQECDQRLGEPAACRYLLNFYDETPRAEAFAALVAEIDKALAGMPA